MENRLDAQTEKGERGVRKTELVIKESVNFRVMFYAIFLAFPLEAYNVKRGLKTIGFTHDL